MALLHPFELKPVSNPGTLLQVLLLLDHLGEGLLRPPDQVVPQPLEGGAVVLAGLHHVLQGVPVVVVHYPRQADSHEGVVVQLHHVVGQVNLVAREGYKSDSGVLRKIVAGQGLLLG